jgi:hypothetical protein
MRLSQIDEQRACQDEQCACVTSPTMMCVPIELEVLNFGIEPRLDVIAVARPSWGTEELCRTPRPMRSHPWGANDGRVRDRGSATTQQACATAAAAMDG